MADGLRSLTTLATPDPIVLALATASGPGSAALVRGTSTLAFRQATDARQHAADVIELIDGVLTDAAWTLDRVDGFAVAIGPGSFTRLRVGLASIKGLAFGGARTVAPVSTLVAMAESAREAVGDDRPVAPALDARRQEIYAAVFDASPQAASGWAARVPESVYRARDWVARLPADAVLVGEGAAVCEAPGIERHADWGAPSAAAVGRIGVRLHLRGRTLPADALVPSYLRRAEAEAQRLGQALEPS